MYLNSIKRNYLFSYENIKARTSSKSFAQKKIRITNNRITKRKSQNLLIMYHAYVVRRFISERKGIGTEKRTTSVPSWINMHLHERGGEAECIETLLFNV